MNAQDRKEFELIHNKIDNITQSIDEMKQLNDKIVSSEKIHKNGEV